MELKIMIGRGRLYRTGWARVVVTDMTDSINHTFEPYSPERVAALKLRGYEVSYSKTAENWLGE